VIRSEQLSIGWRDFRNYTIVAEPKRKQAGVAGANTCLFPLNNYSSLSHVRGSDCVQFMGHDVRTHREFYRLPEDTIQLAKLSKLHVFLLTESGEIESLSG